MSMNFAKFTIYFDGSEDKISRALEIAEEVLEYEGLAEELDEDHSVFVEEDTVLTYVEDIESKLALPMSEQVEGLNFTISGVVDTSESAGEYMNFIIQNQNGMLTVQSSCWYIIFYADNFECYEDFCEEYQNADGEPRYTEDQFKEFKKGEWFVLNSGDGEIVDHVPLEID